MLLTSNVAHAAPSFLLHVATWVSQTGTYLIQDLLPFSLQLWLPIICYVLSCTGAEFLSLFLVIQILSGWETAAGSEFGFSACLEWADLAGSFLEKKEWKTDPSSTGKIFVPQSKGSKPLCLVMVKTLDVWCEWSISQVNTEMDQGRLGGTEASFLDGAYLDAYVKNMNLFSFLHLALS